MKYWKPGRYGLALTSALAFGAIPAFAQDQNAEADTSDDEVVELSPFVVETSKDVGYLATNSISGTRLNMAIKDVPLNLEVITSEFIKDTGATSVRDALRYSAGIVLQSQCDAFDNSKSGDFTVGYANSASGGANTVETATRSAGDSTTKMRGSENQYILQDGFHRVFWDDTINIERVEVLRGPSSLLYGSGCTGGVINFIAKKAIFDKQMTHLGFTVGSNSLERGEIDINVPLVSADSEYAKYKPAVRLVSAWESSESEVDYYSTEHWQTNLMFSFKPFETTTVNINGEFGYKSEYGNGFQNIRASSGEAGQNANWITDIRTLNEDTGYVDSEMDPDLDYRTMNWSGPDCYSKDKYSGITIDITQQIGENAWLKLGYMHTRAEYDSRQIVTNFYESDGVKNMDDGESYTSIWTGETYTSRGGTMADDGTYSGGLYSHYVAGGSLDARDAPDEYEDSVIAYYWQNTEKVEERDQLRADFTYKLDAGAWGNHTFIVGASYEKTKTTSDLYQPAQEWVETYYDEYGNICSDANSSHEIEPYDQYSFKSITDYTPFVYGTQGDGIADNPQVHWMHVVENNWNLAYYACYQGQFFSDKLTVVAGIRWDRYDFNKTYSYPYCNSLVGSTDPYGVAVTTGRVDEVYNTKINGLADGTGAITGTSPQFGLSYAVTDWLSVFAVASSGTMPNYYALDGNGQLLDPEETTDLEAGIKFSFFDGALSGTASVYRLERENIPYYLWWAPAPYKDLYNGYADLDGDGEANDTQILWTYASPGTWYDMFISSGLDADTCLLAIETVFPECWHDAIEEVYAYYLEHEDDPYGDHEWWTFSDFGDVCAALADWTAFTTAAGNTTLCDPEAANEAIANGETYYYFPLIRVTDYDNGITAEDIEALIMSTLYTGDGGWAGNLYTNNNGEHYLYYDNETGEAVESVNNTEGANGAYVAMSDKAVGWDLNLTYTTNFGLQLTAGFSHLNRKVTSKRYKFVSTDKYMLGAQWYTSNQAYGTQYADGDSRTALDTYGDITDASTYLLDSDGNLIDTIAMYGKSTDDSPENEATIWAHYDLSYLADTFKGWKIGLGAQWQDNRLWFSGFISSGNVSVGEDADGNYYIIEKWTDERLTVNGMIEYETTVMEKYDLRFALNVENIGDDKELYGNIWAQGRQFKFSASMDF